ncbi:MAG: radical SAM protein [Planctomycetaceae bacterium]
MKPQESQPVVGGYSNEWKRQPVAGGNHWFQRDSGLNVLRTNGQDQTSFRRLAPRVLQIGLLTPCNLDCSFCYRDLNAPSLLTTEFLVNLLRQADEWGVAEVAFGGGEPLMFRGFTELLRELHSSTRLGLNFTTNGTLLTPSILDDVTEYVGEIRLSAYQSNHYRRTLKQAAARQAKVGINWLVTPEHIGMIEPFVADVLQLGATNVLLLGYKGPRSELLLDESEMSRLRKSLERLHDLPILLDICWHPLLKLNFDSSLPEFGAALLA